MLVGRVELEEGGEIYLNERKYVIERGALEFTNPNRIEPALDVEATSQVAGYDIKLHLSGPVRDLKTDLTSDPPLPEPDILSLLVTGRELKDVQGAELEVAKKQALSLLAGQAGEQLALGARKAFGFSRVRLEPSLISPESDPTARLTIGQDITPKLQLVYSMNLGNSSDQIWIAEYQLTRRFTTRALRQEDNSYRMEFRHDLLFGGPARAGPARVKRQKPKVGSVAFTDGTIFSEEQALGRLGLETGKTYDFFKLRGRMDRLRKEYAGRGYLEANLRLNREVRDGTVDVAVTADAGPAVELQFEGAAVSPGTRQRVRRIWSEGSFDAQRAADAAAAIREPLVKEGYYQSSARYEIEEEQSRKRVRFRIDPGVRFRDLALAFEGASAINASELEVRLSAAGLKLALCTNPQAVTDFLTRYYQRRGFLQVSVEPPRLELDPAARTARAVVSIQEGPEFRFGEVSFAGNEAMDAARLRGLAALTAGESYRPERLRDAVDRLDRLYRENGYNDAVVRYRIIRDAASRSANIAFEIDEKRRAVVREVAVEGNSRTSAGFVIRQVGFAPGDPLDVEKIGRARKNLYDAAVYSFVDFVPEEIAGSAGGDPGVKPIRLRVIVKEIQPFRVRYGGFFDTERGPGFIGDVADRNLLGKAATLGLRVRYDADLKEGRAYFSQPFIRALPLRSNATLFARREAANSFITDRVGFSLQQEKQLRNHFLLDYGYRYERTHTFDKVPDPLLPSDLKVPLARLRASLTRDTRDDILDATTGSFTSQAIEYAPRRLGSDLRFMKYFGQYFHYLPLRPGRETEKGRERPRWVYAGAARVGLAKGFDGQEIIPAERFFAGGGTTLRGFKQNHAGALDRNGNPLGGEAMFVVNNEVRLPLVSIFDGVGFFDLGNVYSKLGDFNPLSIRKSAGVGLRVRTRFVLLRLDYGIKLDRRSGESRGGLFFSIGQAY